MEKGYRWGGVWDEPDSVHIDDNLVGSDNVLWESLYKETQPNCQEIFDDEEERTTSANDVDFTTTTVLSGSQQVALSFIFTFTFLIFGK